MFFVAIASMPAAALFAAGFATTTVCDAHVATTTATLYTATGSSPLDVFYFFCVVSIESALCFVSHLLRRGAAL